MSAITNDKFEKGEELPQLGQVSTSSLDRDAVFGDITDGGPNYRNVCTNFEIFLPVLNAMADNCGGTRLDGSGRLLS